MGFEDIIHQELFTSDDDDFKTTKPIKDKSILAYVHELDIYNFESDAWKKNILSQKQPDFKGLPCPALTKNRYGIGFLIIHKGVVTNWIMFNWWGFEDIIHQELFTSDDDDFKTIKPAKDKSILACVHELDIYSFESDAWKKNILSQKQPDFKGYLNTIYQQ